MITGGNGRGDRDAARDRLRICLRTLRRVDRDARLGLGGGRRSRRYRRRRRSVGGSLAAEPPEPGRAQRRPGRSVQRHDRRAAAGRGGEARRERALAAPAARPGRAGTAARDRRPARPRGPERGRGPSSPRGGRRWLARRHVSTSAALPRNIPLLAAAKICAQRRLVDQLAGSRVTARRAARGAARRPDRPGRCQGPVHPPGPPRQGGEGGVLTAAREPQRQQRAGQRRMDGTAERPPGLRQAYGAGRVPRSRGASSAAGRGTCAGPGGPARRCAAAGHERVEVGRGYRHAAAPGRCRRKK